MQSETLSRQKLYELVWSTPLSVLAKKYRISDNGLRKICVRMNIPLPPMGHWQKVQHGRKVRQIVLPEDNTAQPEIDLEMADPNAPPQKTLVNEANDLQQQIEIDLGDKLIVPLNLTKPEPLTIATREIHKASLRRDWTSSIYNQYPDRLDIKVGENMFQRALLLFDTLIKALKARNHEVIVYNHNTIVRLFGEEIEIRLREKNKMTKEIKNNWTTATYHPTGRLYFGIKFSYINDKIWTDGLTELEHQLSSIIAHLEIKGKELVEERKEREIENQKHEEEKRKRQEFEEKQEVELEKFKSLLFSVSRWQQLRLIRSFIDEVESKSSDANTQSSEQVAWIDWARKKADWYDPQINGYDELLDGVDKETLKAKRSSYL